jgi:Domain of unknown function (DUF4365)
MKKISNAAMIGDLGITLIQRIVQEMGFLWYGSGGTEAGIDGTIEIRHKETGEATNLIIQVQSKASEGTFQAETATGFDYLCTERDIDYWMNGNTPVILIRSRPSRNEAYWISIQRYFADPAKRASRKLRFDKVANRFEASSRSALEALALPAATGLDLGTEPRNEIIYSDLLPVRSLPENYYTALTAFPNQASVTAELASSTQRFPRGFTVHGKTIYSFHNLNDAVWSAVCDSGTIERSSTVDWAYTVEPQQSKLFVELLNTTLRDQLFGEGISFSKIDDCFFMRGGEGLQDQSRSYESRQKAATRTVFKAYRSKKDKEQVSYYRHAAFSGKFVSYGGRWYLQITPTYRFTKDGFRPSHLSALALSGIKRLENNQAVHGQVVMWGSLLRDQTLFSSHHLIQFEELLQFSLDHGFDDATWLKREPIDPSVLPADVGQGGLL